MTQPRKEQIKDLRTNYTRIDSVGVTAPITIGTPDVPGGTIQTIQNGSENYYNEFLASTITQAVGGSETNTSAFLFGNPGPFITPVVPGASFTVTLPGINAGNPVLITFQPSDSVSMGGSPVITTSLAAARINTALTTAGVSASSPVAQNINGRLVLISANTTGYTIGASAEITVNDVSVGILAALGFTSASSVTALGITAPKRGIVTTSGDGFGGYIQLQALDGSPAITQPSVMINVGGFGNLPLYPAGQNIFARIQQFPGLSANPKFVLSYFRQGTQYNSPTSPLVGLQGGTVPGKIISSGGKFSTITTSDTFIVEVQTVNPNFYASVSGSAIQTDPQAYVFTVTFATAPTGPQDVVNAINAAWNACPTIASQFGAGSEPGRAGVQSTLQGPFYLDPNTDMMFLIINGNAPVRVQGGFAGLTAAGFYTAADVAVFINTAIANFGQAAFATASVSASGFLRISTTSMNGPNSTIQIVANDLTFSTANAENRDIRTLDKLGLGPGIYAGSAIASLYGADEIQLICPDSSNAPTVRSNDPATIVFSAFGDPPVAAKLGLAQGGGLVFAPSGYVSIGGATPIIYSFEPVTPPVSSADGISFGQPLGLRALIPEMMEFGEVPDNIETTSDNFHSTGQPSTLNPGLGASNIGLSPLIGLDGKISPDLINKAFGILNVDSLTLGGRNLGGGGPTPQSGNQIPRLITAFSNDPNNGLTLLWEGSSTAGLTGAGASQIMRLYADANGSFWLTCNANYQGTTTTPPIVWNSDTPTQSASAVLIGQSIAPSTTIAIGSNGQTLPQATINVASTIGFNTAGTITIGGSIVTYTGTTATTFTGCTGGTATMTTGEAVTTSDTPKLEMLYAPAPAGATFTFSGSPGAGGFPPVALDPAGSAGNSAAFLQLGNSPATNDLTPRIQTAASPAAGNITLLWQQPPQTVSAVLIPGIRIYAVQQQQFPTGAGAALWFTINAFWNGTAWQKDVSGVEAEALLLWQAMGSVFFGPLSVFYQAPTDNTPWVDWGTASANSLSLLNVNGVANVTNVGTLAAGATLANAVTSRILGVSAPPYPSAGGVGRTLIFQTLLPFGGPVTPVGVLRIYHGQTVDFQSAIDITINAVYTNGTPGHWSQDDVTRPSFALRMLGAVGTDNLGTLSFLTQVAGFGTWNDIQWGMTTEFFSFWGAVNPTSGINLFDASASSASAQLLGSSDNTINPGYPTSGSLLGLFNPSNLQLFSISNVTNNGGIIEVTTTGSFDPHIPSGTEVLIVGVVGTGNVGLMNGNWTVTRIDGTHFNLNGSNFTGSFTSAAANGIIVNNNFALLAANGSLFAGPELGGGYLQLVGGAAGQATSSNYTTVNTLTCLNIPKAWVSVVDVAGSITILNSFNVASVTISATFDLVVTFQNAFVARNAGGSPILCSVGNSDGGLVTLVTSTLTSATFNLFNTFAVNPGSELVLVDLTGVVATFNIAFFGQQ